VTLQSATLPRVELEIVRGQARRKQRPVNVPAFLIGASRDCDLVLGDSQFAEVHAYLIVHAGGVSIRHLGSGPELIVNGQEVARATLKDGDRLRTGPYEFVIHIADQASIDDSHPPAMQLPVGNWQEVETTAGMKSVTAAAQLLTDIRAALKRHEHDAYRPTRAAS
jgi:pSer/pThr/pTyr-binding forkhead associated (FHA) protein